MKTIRENQSILQRWALPLYIVPLLCWIMTTAVSVQSVHAQSVYAQSAKQQSNKGSGVALFQSVTSSLQKNFDFITASTRKSLENNIAEYDIVEINPEAMKQLINEQPWQFEVQLPTSQINKQYKTTASQGAEQLVLERFDIFTPDAQILTATAAGERPANFDRRSVVAYKGTVAGKAGSSVVLTVTKESMYLNIRLSENESYMIEPLASAASSERTSTAAENDGQGRNLYVRYDTKVRKQDRNLDCGVTDEHQFEEEENHDKPSKKSKELNALSGILECKLAAEVDYAGFQKAGSEAAAATYVASVIAYTSAIYERDVQSRIVISYLKIWTTTDPYAASSDQLGTFRSYWNTNQTQVNRNLAHLFSNGSQGVAYIGGIKNCSVGYGVSKINWTGAGLLYPNVYIVAHEIGHNYGSTHTHICVWPAGNDPNGTFIDQCSTNPGGGGTVCFTTAVQSRGTLMSYCSQSDMVFHQYCKNIMKTTMQTLCKPMATVQSTMFSIAGRVLNTSGGALSTVAVSTGDTTVFTNSQGNYVIPNRANGTYTVTPTKAGYTFTPVSRTVVLNDNHAGGVDFVGNTGGAAALSLNGALSYLEGGVYKPLAGITVKLNTGVTAVSGADGKFVFSNLSAQVYTLTIVSALPPGYVMTFTSALIDLSGGASQTWAASAMPSVISGKVTLNGVGLQGVTLSAGGKSAVSASGSGVYSIQALPGGTYTVTPTLAGYTFTPVSQSITMNTATYSGSQILNVNFTATVTGVTSSLTVSPQSVTVVAGGQNNIGIGVTSNVSWTATSNQSWVIIPTGSGTGNGNFLFNVSANGTTSQRTATITVTGGGITRTITIVQAGAVVTPALTLSLSSLTLAAGISSSNVGVTSNVSWTATSNQSWITALPASGTNDGSITLSAQANGTTSQRTATITVTGGGITRTISVTQAGLPPLLLVTPTSITSPAAGATHSAFVQSNVSWTATSNQTWATVNPTSSTNNDTLKIQTQPNTGSTVSRTAIITITGGGQTRTVTVTQNADVVLTTSVTTINIGYQAVAASNIGVVASVSWTVTSNQPWLQLITSSGNGNGTFSYKADANLTTSARTGTFTITGGGLTRTITVNQAAAPAVILTATPSPKLLSSILQASSVSVMANVAWTATTSATWLVLEQSSGTGDATLNFKVSENMSTSSRSTVIVLQGGGLTFNIIVTQQGVTPTLNVNIGSIQAVANSSSPISVQVYSTNVSWTVTSNQPWVMASPTSGSGNGSFTISIQPNQSTSQRTATVTISGGGITRTIPITQAGASGLIVTPSMFLGSSAGIMDTTITVQSNSVWTVSGSTNWAQLPYSYPGTVGTSTFKLRIYPNDESTSRSVTLTVQNATESKVIIITQAGATTKFSGKVTLSNGSGVSTFVSLSRQVFGMGTSTQTIANGSFNFSSDYANGKYVIKPNSEQYTYTPTQYEVTASGPNITNLNFIATPKDKPVFGSTTVLSAGTSIRVTWQTIPGAASYQVDCATDTAFTNKIVNNVSTVPTTYTFTGFVPGTTYYYRVRAVFSDSTTGAYSATGIWTTPPNPPTVSAASSVTPTSFVLTWTAVPKAVRYKIEASLQSNFSPVNYTAEFATPGTLSYVVSGSPIQPGKTIYYRMYAAIPNAGAGSSMVWSYNPSSALSVTLPMALAQSNPSDETTFGSLELKTTSVTTALMTNDARVYPNPASERLVVETPLNDADEVRVRIYNAIGGLVLEQRLKGGLGQLDISKLSVGAYNVEIVSNTRRFMSRVVINR